MKFLKPKSFVVLICAVLLLSWKPAGNTGVRKVDLAFCIDLSASTNGILNDVRNRMWNIANNILLGNEMTELRMAVVGYGRPSFGGSDGYVKVISELTNDFDWSSYNLFQLKAMIEKGDQFVPNALFETFKELKWSKDPAAEKMVVLIGNGSVYTGSINLVDLCEEYRKNNIRINTVFVAQNNKITSQTLGYKNIAVQTGGTFNIMKASSRQVVNKTPSLPSKVKTLNDSLNNTFMFFTKDAEERKKFLFETDKNVMKMGEGYFYSRLLYKTSKHYNESYTIFDLTGYLLKYNKMPDHVNLDYLSRAENTMNISEIEKRARSRASLRKQLDEEIKNLFTRSDQSMTPVDTLLDNFVLSSYR